MRRRMLGGLALISVFLLAGLARAEAPLALRLIPAEVELVAAVPHPAKVLRLIEVHPIAKELTKNELFLSLYDSTKYHRLEQVIAHFEKKLGRTRHEILEQLSSGGAFLGARLSKDPAVVVVVQAGDEELLKTFLAEAVSVVDQELDRQDSKDRYRKASHGKVPTLHLGKGLHFAQVGTFFLFGTDEKLFHKAIDLHHDKAAIPAESILTRLPRKERDKAVLAWTWLDFESAQRNKEFADGLKAATTDGFLKLVAGGFLDVLQRTPHLDFELVQEGKDFRLRFGMGRGTKGMSEVARSFVATEEKRLLPPLLPPRVLSSTTWTFDIGAMWKNKKAWLGEQVDKDLDKAEKDIKPFLGGVTLGELLHGLGWNQRIVTAEMGASPYKIKPTFPVTQFGVVFDLRDERSGQILEKAVRAGALAATFQFGMKMKDEEHHGQKLVAYYFNEDRKVPFDEGNIRFNFSPSFAKVGNRFILSSTSELAKDLIDCLAKEGEPLPAGKSWRTDLFASGLASNLKTARQQLLTGAILDQGLSPVEAGKQIDDLIVLVRGLGTVRWEIHYGEEDYRMDLLWQYGGK